MPTSDRLYYTAFLTSFSGKHQIDITHSKIHANIRSIILKSVFDKLLRQTPDRYHTQQNACQHQIDYTKQRFCQSFSGKTPDRYHTQQNTCQHQIDYTKQRFCQSFSAKPPDPYRTQQNT